MSTESRKVRNSRFALAAVAASGLALSGCTVTTSTTPIAEPAVTEPAPAPSTSTAVPVPTPSATTPAPSASTPAPSATEDLFDTGGSAISDECIAQFVDYMVEVGGLPVETFADASQESIKVLLEAAAEEADMGIPLFCASLDVGLAASTDTEEAADPVARTYSLADATSVREFGRIVSSGIWDVAVLAPIPATADDIVEFAGDASGGSEIWLLPIYVANTGDEATDPWFEIAGAWETENGEYVESEAIVVDDLFSVDMLEPGDSAEAYLPLEIGVGDTPSFSEGLVLVAINGVPFWFGE